MTDEQLQRLFQDMLKISQDVQQAIIKTEAMIAEIEGTQDEQDRVSSR